ncbi:hypothetical protein MSPP1_002856 [Malassezia sp. CBS 17886]|nr:hypothetical protein MSPP1_002856 [Malassezia sp. CBS 17886]
MLTSFATLTAALALLAVNPVAACDESGSHSSGTNSYSSGSGSHSSGSSSHTSGTNSYSSGASSSSNGTSSNSNGTSSRWDDNKLQLGLPWAADSRWAANIPGAVSWYHHWEKGVIKEMPQHAEYVPMFWGPQKMQDWNKRKAEIAEQKPEYILAFNEPDVSGQANLDVDTAVNLFMQHLQPYADQGIKLTTPQLVYDTKWLSQFMSKCKARGCDISVAAVHWYGGHSDFNKMQTWIEKVHQITGLPVWVSEYGVTSASNPSQDQVESFVAQSLKYMKSQKWIQRAAWHGCYDVTNPPDTFASPQSAFFSNGGVFRKLAWTWMPTAKQHVANRFAKNHYSKKSGMHRVHNYNLAKRA